MLFHLPQPAPTYSTEYDPESRTWAIKENSVVIGSMLTETYARAVVCALSVLRWFLRFMPAAFADRPVGLN